MSCTACMFMSIETEIMDVISRVIVGAMSNAKLRGGKDLFALIDDPTLKDLVPNRRHLLKVLAEANAAYRDPVDDAVDSIPGLVRANVYDVVRQNWSDYDIAHQDCQYADRLEREKFAEMFEEPEIVG